MTTVQETIPENLQHDVEAALASGCCGFAGAWVAAFSWLPTLSVAAALAGWIADTASKVSRVGKVFKT